MRVFMTGASGYIGSAIAQNLIWAGHEVIGLARSEEAASRLRAAGVEPYRGGLDEPDRLHDGAAAADGVVHAAFRNDFSDYEAAGRADRRAIEALGAALEGSGKPLVSTSVTTVLTPGRVGTEEDGPDDARSFTAARIPSENAALAFAQRGVRASVVRLPPTVHGEEDRHGFIPALIALARRTGQSAMVGDGSNRWSAVHRLDAGELFRLALESAPAGARLHGVGEEGVAFSEIAAAIGRHTGLPVTSVPLERADHFEWLASFAAADNPVSSTITREVLGWKPEHPALIADMDAGHYFAV